MAQERTVMFQMPSVLSGTLACIAGTVAGRSWELSAGTFVIGRLENADLHLPSEPGVSKTHCKIVAEGDSYVLVDCESRNGTIVNGSPVQRQALRDGDEIRVCGCVLRFTQLGGNTGVKVRNVDAGVMEPPPTQIPMADDAPMMAHDRSLDRPSDRVVHAPSPSPYEMADSLPSNAAQSAMVYPSRTAVLGKWFGLSAAGAFLFGAVSTGVLALGASPDDTIVEAPAADAPADAKPGDAKPGDADQGESGAKVDGAKGDGAKANPAVKDVADAEQALATGGDAATADAAKLEAAKLEAAKADAAKAEQAKADAAKAEQAKADEAAKLAETKAAEAKAAETRPERSERRRPRDNNTASSSSATEDEGGGGGDGKAFAASAEGSRSETLKVKGGKVKTVEAAEGDVVGRGQVLVTFEEGDSSDDLATLRDRIASLEGAEDEDAKRDLKAAKAKLEALTGGKSGGPLIAGIAGKLTGFSVSPGQVLKQGEAVGRVVEGEASHRVKVRVDRSTRVRKGQEAILVLKRGGEGSGTVSSVSGRNVTVETGDLAAEEVDSVRF